MKNKKQKLFISLLIITSIFISACSFSESKSRDVIKMTEKYGITGDMSHKTATFFSNVCVPKDTPEIGIKDISHVMSAAVFNLTKNQALYGYNSLERVYPASTTKILTALTALKYGNLDQEITVSDNAVNVKKGSSLAHLNKGDVLSLRQLLYGLMLPSGNDAAVAIAEGVAGSQEKFLELMNSEAKSLGCTHSNFITVNGLHDDNHYTTPYDIYLIANAAIQNNDIAQVMSTTSYDAYYKDANGQAVTNQWKSTDLFASGDKKLPDGFTFVGGKTGTTGEAKYCLVLVTKNPEGDTIISEVYGADNRYNLYLVQEELLTAVAQ